MKKSKRIFRKYKPSLVLGNVLKDIDFLTPASENYKIKAMKPREKKPEIIFRIINNETGEHTGSYSRAYCDEYDFRSADEARSANCHGIFENKEKYRIARYKVTYELIEDDVN